jgi:hypothetical protein
MGATGEGEEEDNPRKDRRGSTQKIIYRVRSFGLKECIEANFSYLTSWLKQQNFSLAFWMRPFKISDGTPTLSS